MLRGQETFDDGCVRQIINTLTQELNISRGSLVSWNANTKQFVQAGLQLLRMLKKYTPDVVAEFMSHFILGDKDIRYAILKLICDKNVMALFMQFHRYNINMHFRQRRICYLHYSIEPVLVCKLCSLMFCQVDCARQPVTS